MMHEHTPTSREIVDIPLSDFELLAAIFHQIPEEARDRRRRKRRSAALRSIQNRNRENIVDTESTE